MKPRLAAGTLKYLHASSALGWAAAGVYGWHAGWASSIRFLFIASVWANVAGHLAGISGERPDQEVLDKLEENT